MAMAKDYIPHLKCPLRLLKTGSWRLLKPVVALEKCNRCLLCWLFCPEGAIRRNPAGIFVSLDYCKGCGICARECRKGAIDMVEDEGAI
jgi:2-oxoacid:acceptor oxidoreductase delta subunit (pyruvate/2-ketoisovalerate family)